MIIDLSSLQFQICWWHPTNLAMSVDDKPLRIMPGIDGSRWHALIKPMCFAIIVNWQILSKNEDEDVGSELWLRTQMRFRPWGLVTSTLVLGLFDGINIRHCQRGRTRRTVCCEDSVSRILCSINVSQFYEDMFLWTTKGTKLCWLQEPKNWFFLNHNSKHF